MRLTEIQTNKEATAGFEPAIGVLQTPALPLGHVATHIQKLMALDSEFL